MEKYLPLIIIALCAVIIVLLIIIITRKPKNNDSASIDTAVLKEQLEFNSKNTDEKIEKLSSGMNRLTNTNYEQQLNLINALNSNTEKQTKALSDAIALMQRGNEEKLEQMRKTVDEKLTETLNQRLNSSFKTVSDQLSNVYKSLGEMKELSAGVTTTVSGLNRTLSNVKTRGTWAEVQLGNLLEQIIPNMFECNVQTNPSYNGRVEFAVKIPNQENGSWIYLPIDSKFPLEDYARLTVAADNADVPAMESARKALEARIRDEGKLIKNYISLPHTTPFAVMYLATEGLYAEITSSKTGIAEKLQADGIMIAGPSTIVALLNSLALGFRTIAINEKANEVWKILGTAKAQYDKFGELLAKAKKKLDEAGKVLDEADHRNEVIQKKLKGVETIEE
ncbi:MAG: DNA recombination protein RmuC [Eubacterium sp.]|nr:DNA recombination protein RmuC [Eubacterium sp.]